MADRFYQFVRPDDAVGVAKTPELLGIAEIFRRDMVEAFTLENYVKFFADPYYSRVMLVTIAVAVSRYALLACLKKRCSGGIAGNGKPLKSM